MFCDNGKQWVFNLCICVHTLDVACCKILFFPCMTVRQSLVYIIYTLMTVQLKIKPTLNVLVIFLSTFSRDIMGVKCTQEDDLWALHELEMSWITPDGLSRQNKTFDVRLWSIILGFFPFQTPVSNTQILRASLALVVVFCPIVQS